MRTPIMDQDNLHNSSVMGSHPATQDQANTRRMRSNSIHNQGSDKDDHRSRASSTAMSDVNSETSRYNRARGTVNDAIHSAIDPVDPNHSTISPEILNQITSQITASVLQQLKATSQFSSPPTSAPDQQETTSSVGGSPPMDRNKVYTPPSPYRASEEAAQTGSPTSPRKHSKFPDAPEPRRPPSPPFSHGTLSEDSDAKEGNLRARGDRSSKDGSTKSRSDRLSSGGEGTILEKIWGELFDAQDQATTRLSQFLRGIAVYIIEDYEPKHSLVITPDKMQKYYEETKITNETYPWQVIFDDRTSSISRLFREIGAQHHLVQDRLNERPDIPGLTPIGFETWMLLVLKAHPEMEFERLAKTALSMPVSNPDDRKERFPKELSRRQFPKTGDSTLVSKLSKVVLTHCGVKVTTRSGSMSEKDKSTQASNRLQESNVPPKQNQTDYSLSQTTTRSSVPEVDVNNLRATVSEVAVDDSPIEVIPPPQIERERKPYVANPGGGKTYDNLDAQILQAAESKQAQQPPKLTRSTSMNNGRGNDPKQRSSQSISIHQTPNQRQTQAPPPVEIPQPTRPRTGSTYHRDVPRRGDRNRSPSISRGNEVSHKSDGDVAYGSYHSSGPGDYAPNSWRTENRQDHHRGSFSVTSGDARDREPRQRYHSTSAGDGQRYYNTKDYPSDEEYYRSNNSGFSRPDSQYPQSQHMPPSSYRSRA